MRVAAERPLEDPAVAASGRRRRPTLELADAVRRLLRVELGHARVVEQLAADHRVAEVGLPGVGGGDVAERRGDAALGHDRVRLAEQRLADEPDVRAGRRGLDRRPQAGAAGADDEDVVRGGVSAAAVADRSIAPLEVDRRVGDDPDREQADVDVGERRPRSGSPTPSAMWCRLSDVIRCHSV